MQLELKNIKHSPSLSEETYAFTATLYRDGKAVADIKNDGHGGSDMRYPRAPFTHSDIQEIDRWCKANLPVLKSQYGDMEQDLELWCSEKVTERILTADLRRQLRGSLLFIRDGKCMTMRMRGKRTLSEAEAKSMAAQLAKEGVPLSHILNLVPFIEAVRLYRQYATP